MTNFQIAVIVLWCLSISVLSCYGFRVKKVTFTVSHNLRIANNHVYSLDANNTLECGIKCSEDERCSVSTYNSETYDCALHFTNSSYPLLATAEHGMVMLTIKGNDIPIDISLDPESLHDSRYMSSDGTIISNSLSNSVKAWPPGNNALTNYKGAVSRYCVTQNQKIFFEFQFEYELLVDFSTLTLTKMTVFDFGIADKSTVDNSYYSGASEVDGWSFTMTNCVPDNICLGAWRNSKKKFETPVSSNAIGTHATGIYAALVDRNDHSFSLFNTQPHSLIYKHTNVLSSADLCPVFSFFVYSNTSVTLLNAKQILTKP